MQTENCRQTERWAGFVVSQTNGEVPLLEFLVYLHLSRLCKPCVYMTCELRLGAGKRSVTLDMADWLLSWRAFQLGWFTTCRQTFYVEQQHSSTLNWEVRFSFLRSENSQRVKLTLISRCVNQLWTETNRTEIVNARFTESEALIKIGRHRLRVVRE